MEVVHYSSVDADDVVVADGLVFISSRGFRPRSHNAEVERLRANIIRTSTS